MKILSPLRAFDEIKPLSDAGADQFYCGLLSDNEINDRPNTATFNFQTIEEVEKANNFALKNNKDIYLAINGVGGNIEKSILQARAAEKIGLKGIIISNLFLMNKIDELNLNLEIFASSVLGCINNESIEFLKRFGIKGIHLPDQLSIQEITDIKKANDDIELSVFDEHCYSLESFCRFGHIHNNRYVLPCCGFREENKFGERINKRFSEEFMLKKISGLEKTGIDIVKIVGRNHSLKQKLYSVKLIRGILEKSD